jgi:hypothetical protein
LTRTKLKVFYSNTSIEQPSYVTLNFSSRSKKTAMISHRRFRITEPSQ